MKKIFTEGIDQSSAVIVAISSVSVSKRWVAEELDAAVVKRIQSDTRLIPVVLDGLTPTELPPAFRHLLYEPVFDTANMDRAVDRVVRSIAGTPDKPALGTPPLYSTATTHSVAGLDQIDSLVLKAAGDEAIRDFGEMFRTKDFVDGMTSLLDVSAAEVVESLEVLEADHYIELHRTFGSGLEAMSSFKLTASGFETYATNFIEDYNEIRQAVVSQVVNLESQQGTDDDVASGTGAPRMVVLHILRTLHSQGLLTLSQSMGPTTHFFNVSPKLRRLF